MSDDPMAEFLARERAALGTEADFFQNDSSATPSDLALSPVQQQQQQQQQSGGSFAEPMMVDSEPAEEEALSPEAQMTAGSQFQEEWQTKQRGIIEDRDRQSEEKHVAIVEEAKQSIDKFYEEYNEKKEKAIEQNRASQEMELQAANKGNLWERALKQIDMATKASVDRQQSEAASAKAARDTSRMRELLQDLKKDKDAPGVKAKTAKA
ncbi:Clathrin light chain [Coemansia sp. RSA 2399]|nr:Clathrin light chain [Coemansia sp. RSA 2399]KAJ1895110.1 Clathrin light chain [Coemansia sp. IMI 209127]